MLDNPIEVIRLDVANQKDLHMVVNGDQFELVHSPPDPQSLFADLDVHTDWFNP
jgi:hypothetical protein